jgi:hypothetical protein|tara:strand:- start:1101 stop:2261 length:1161 start_codon:yes stop_codon:yes gene_type:complete
MSGSRGYIRTIEDMERLYYGAGAGANAWAYSGTDLLKADSPLMSSTTGTYQAIFGRKVWSQLNQEFNAFSILPKKPWEKSGWRVVTDKPDRAKGGGVAENATLPESTKPTFAEVSTKPKTVAHTFDLSETAMFLADKDDGLGDARAVMKMEMAKHHAEHINVMLLQDIDTPAGNDYESLDRCLSSAFVETASFTDVSTISDHNQYNITRSTGSTRQWYDSNVDAGSGGTERALSLNIMDGMFRNVWERGGQPKVILTGYDTLEKIQQLLQPQQRFTEMKRVVPGVNGVKGVPGMEAGFVVATYNGVPLIPSKDVHAESGGLSRMYYIDSDYLYFSTAKPTLYHESGIETGDPFGINRLGQMGMFHTMGELWQLFYGSHGKVRDLSA